MCSPLCGNKTLELIYISRNGVSYASYIQCVLSVYPSSYIGKLLVTGSGSGSNNLSSCWSDSPGVCILLTQLFGRSLESPNHFWIFSSNIFLLKSYFVFSRSLGVIIFNVCTVKIYTDSAKNIWSISLTISTAGPRILPRNSCGRGYGMHYFLNLTHSHHWKLHNNDIYVISYVSMGLCDSLFNIL